MADYETHECDVLIIGAGGAGLRAAVEASSLGARTTLVCKSLLGKAHTVMAEGGMAAALANVNADDSWKVHFRDTMRGGKFLNHWRMAQIHAQEAPERVDELEEWGALFDRTPDGRIRQRDFGGHRYARLAHVGDRTGLEIIRTLQQHAVHRGIEVYQECAVNALLKDGDRVSGALGYWRESGDAVVFRAKAIVLATGGVGQIFEITTNSWEGTAEGESLALKAGASLKDVEFMQFHPTGMVWPLSVRGLLVTEAVRGDGGVLLNSQNERFMFNYIPEMFAAETADTPEEADRWYTDKSVRRTPDLLPRDEVARAIHAEVGAGRGSPHGGVMLDIASRRTPEEIRQLLPSMYKQFLELADVDITQVAMEVGPTAHYMNGGIDVDPETAATAVPGLYAAGEAAAGLHGANRLGGNSLSDLVVFGRRAGMAAAEYVEGVDQPAVADADVEAAVAEMRAPLTRESGENPYTLQVALQETMQQKVGIIRNGPDLEEALTTLHDLRERLGRAAAAGGQRYNPGWHLALSMDHMLTVAEAMTTAAIERKESRGSHTRDDFVGFDDHFGAVNVLISAGPDGAVATQQPLPQMPNELQALLDLGTED